MTERKIPIYDQTPDDYISGKRPDIQAYNASSGPDVIDFYTERRRILDRRLQTQWRMAAAALKHDAMLSRPHRRVTRPAGPPNTASDS